jgi:ectoine hydroxylase-related dioxygenase (phytanoyl-CoA dioxygenase family)
MTSPAQVLQQVEELVANGDYEQAIAILQPVAKESGDVDLAQRLVQLRVDWAELNVELIDPEPMYEANELLGDPQALRARLDKDGYLFLRGIIPRDTLLDLRDQLTRVLADEGWIEDGARRMEAHAISRPRREGQPKFFKVHDRIMKMEALHSLAHESHLMDVMRQALGDSAFPHPLCITRLIFPDTRELSTPPHQDFPNNQGTPNLTAAWIPLGDCSVDDGSLAVKEGSHKFGVLPLDFHLGAGNRQAVLSDEVKACRWVGADFKLGDILLFPALTVHRALDNKNVDRMRLSVDFRYQLEGEALTPVVLQPHFQRLSWKEIYKGWKSKEYQYYWKTKDYVEVPFDPQLHELAEEDMFEAYIQELQYNVALTRRQQAREAGAGS